MPRCSPMPGACVRLAGTVGDDGHHARTLRSTLVAGAAAARPRVAYAAGFEVRSFRLRRVDVPGAAARACGPCASSSSPTSTWCRPARASGAGSSRWPALRARPRRQHRRQPLRPRRRTRGARRARAADRPFPAPTSSARTTTTARSSQNPPRYLVRRPAATAARQRPVDAALGRPARRLRGAGWVDLTNTRGCAQARGRTARAARPRRPAHQARPLRRRSPAAPTTDADLSLGVVHAPYLRVLDAFTADGYPLILAGHTHGGQLCIPFYGALVTNCDLDHPPRQGPLHPLRRRHAPTSTSRPGCGTNRYTPVRFACPPGGDPAHPGPAGPGGLTHLARRNRISPPARGGLILGALGVWRSLVARFVRDEEVVGSNPATPTRAGRCLCRSEAPAACRGPMPPEAEQTLEQRAAQRAGAGKGLDV